MSEATIKPGPDQTAAFFKLWADSFSKLSQAAFSFSPDALPPEMLRQVRSGIFQALAQCWDEYMRSPQFLGTMKQMMDQSIQIRKFTNESLTKAWHDLGGTAQSDVDHVLIALQHVEQRTMDRMDELTKAIAALGQQLSEIKASQPARESLRRPIRLKPPNQPVKRAGRVPATKQRKRTT